jgi:hypothetical protein
MFTETVGRYCRDHPGDTATDNDDVVVMGPFHDSFIPSLPSRAQVPFSIITAAPALYTHLFETGFSV